MNSSKKIESVHSSSHSFHTTFDSERVSGIGPTTWFTANRLARQNKACTSTRTVVSLTYAALQVLGDVGVIVFGGQRGSCLPL